MFLRDLQYVLHFVLIEKSYLSHGSEDTHLGYFLLTHVFWS